MPSYYVPSTPSSRHRSHSTSAYPYPGTPGSYGGADLRRFNSTAGTAPYYGTPAYGTQPLAPQTFFVAPSSHGSDRHRHRSSSRHRHGHHHHSSSSHHGHHHKRSHSTTSHRARYPSVSYGDNSRYYRDTTSHRPYHPTLGERIRSFFGFAPQARYVDARTGRDVDARGRPIYRY